MQSAKSGGCRGLQVARLARLESGDQPISLGALESIDAVDELCLASQILAQRRHGEPSEVRFAHR